VKDKLVNSFTVLTYKMRERDEGMNGIKETRKGPKG
jgi:hypothetical protein